MEDRRMTQRTLLTGAVAVLAAVLALRAGAAEESAAARGRKALLENCYIPAIWSRDAYDHAWKHWEGVTAKPADYDQAFREAYGLHPAPYANGGLPMGLREGRRLLG